MSRAWQKLCMWARNACWFLSIYVRWNIISSDEFTVQVFLTASCLSKKNDDEADCKESELQFFVIWRMIRSVCINVVLGYGRILEMKRRTANTIYALYNHCLNGILAKSRKIYLKSYVRIACSKWPTYYFGSTPTAVNFATAEQLVYFQYEKPECKLF